MSEQAALAPGMRVLCRDAEWLVTRVDPADYVHKSYAVHCIGADEMVRGHESIFLTELDTLEPVDPRQTKLVEDTSNGFRLARLFLEAQLRQMPVTGTEPDLDGMGSFHPMHFQQDAVERALLQMRPRLLLADAVGLGKTIEVGMILTELIRRGRANRILVLAKKSMLTQFQSELWNRFAIPLVRLDSDGIARLRLRIPESKNPFEVYHRIIISMDTLKDIGRYRHFLEDTRWDVVVIDEAHNVAGASVPERNLSYRLARLLARKTDSLILTTATPHNGKRETFGRLITLLDPSAIPDPKLREYTADDIKSFFMMRFKEDVRAEAGQHFAVRKVIPPSQTSCDATAGEEAVYQRLAELRSAIQDKTVETDALIQWGLYKSFLSSPEACHSTIQSRTAKLKREDPGSAEISHLVDLGKLVGGLSLPQSSRYQLLKVQLKELKWDGSAASPRLLLFTESRKTQDALAEALAKDYGLRYSDAPEDQPDQVLAVINGSSPDVHLMKTVEAFGTGKKPVRLLLATDVAAEGLNLHHECHNLIHYDLPWSIITLIQRNGRIDRFGQMKTPVLRYLMVNTKQGLLKGDREIFERLIQKVEEINRSTRTGESVLRLYDPEAEEQFIAQKGLLAGDKDVLDKRTAAADAAEAKDTEETILQAVQMGQKEQEELRRMLLGDSAPTPTAQAQAAKPSERLRLYRDREFLIEGYRYLATQSANYLPIEESESGRLLTLTPPQDLKRRLGARDATGDVIFGATAIPEESWADNGQFRLTDSVDRVITAIQAARNMSGYWTQEMLCTEQHPILQWIAERLVMLMPRGQAPHILSPNLTSGEICFCFIGQVSSKAGMPLAVDGHAISFTKGGGFKHRSLGEALSAAHIESLSNVKRTRSAAQAQALIPSAVEASLKHMKQVEEQRVKRLMPLLRKEERRLQDWSTRRQELLKEADQALPSGHPHRRMHQKQIEEMEAFLKDRRENWRDAYFLAAPQPSTRLVLVIEGAT